MCEHQFEWSAYCGAQVCLYCDAHKGLVRCFCGWSETSPGHGREELEDMGETIDPEEDFPWSYDALPFPDIEV